MSWTDSFGDALSALVLGLYDVCRKHAVRGNSAVDVLLWSSAAGFAAFLERYRKALPVEIAAIRCR